MRSVDPSNKWEKQDVVTLSLPKLGYVNDGRKWQGLLGILINGSIVNDMTSISHFDINVRFSAAWSTVMFV